MRYIILVLLLLSWKAGACSLAPGYEGYIPRPNIKPSLISPKVPKVTRARVRRGKFDETGASCSSAGSILVQLGGPNPVDQTGYKFRLISGSVHPGIFPNRVIMPLRNRYFYNAIVFHFGDGYRVHKPLTAKIEVIAVSPEGKESEPLVFEVSHPGTVDKANESG